MTRAYHTTSDPIHELPRKAYDCRRKAIVLADDSGSVMQPHVPDRLDPWGLGLLELIVLRVRWIVYPHSFLAQESRKVPEGKFIYRCGGLGAADALSPSHLVWVQMYSAECKSLRKAGVHGHGRTKVELFTSSSMGFLFFSLE